MKNENPEGMIILEGDQGEKIGFYVLEETRINARNYLLVTDAPDGEDGEFWVMKDVSEASEEQARYEFVEEENELDGVLNVFKRLLEEEGWEIEI